MIRSVFNCLSLLPPRGWMAIGVIALTASPAAAHIDAMTARLPAPTNAAKPITDGYRLMIELSNAKRQLEEPRPAPATTYSRIHRLPPALRKKALLAHNANGDGGRS